VLKVEYMTELIWDGKYRDGKKVAPTRVALPFQTVETVNESAQDRQRTLNLFAQGRDTDWRNRLIWGDKKYVLPSLLPEFAGKVNLIYIDPPFNVGADFSFTTTIPDSNESFTKEPSIIEQKAYRDTWGRGMDSYLQWFYEAVVLLHELLAEDGSLYVHLDWHVGHYAKVVLDEVFGVDNFRNEIIWKRTTARSDSKTYNHIHDVIYYYSKNEAVVWNKLYMPYDPEQVKKQYRVEEESGRLLQPITLIVPGTRNGPSGQAWRGIDVAARGDHWKYTIDELDRLDEEGKIYWPPAGEVPRLKQYLDEMPGVPLQSIWMDVGLSSNASERLNYDTQKPESLLERIIKTSSNENSLVLDCFCGSGTTAVVAEKLQRRWIACDLGRFAIHTTRKRLLSVPQVKPFVVQNLGKYERQVWQKAEFADEGTKKQALQNAYIDFILKLYSAQRINGYAWIHGVRNGRAVHVASVDAPVSTGDVTNIAAEFKKMMGSGKDAPTTNGVDVLGWDFAFELNEVARQQAAAANITMRFMRIPRDVMDKRAVEQGDIKFFELAALSVDTQVKGRDLELKLTNFMIPPDDVPEEVRGAIKKWDQWVDYWAVDWDNQGDTFHNEWQTYRTRQDKNLKLMDVHRYDEPGTYRVVVKVVDILGNDTTKTLQVGIE
jgi:adenine-specific DNA-methyltransferase